MDYAANLQNWLIKYETLLTRFKIWHISANIQLECTGVIYQEVVWLL